MSRGHVRGTKHERPGSQDWYAEIAAETLRRLDAEAAQEQEVGQQETPQTA